MNKFFRKNKESEQDKKNEISRVAENSPWYSLSTAVEETTRKIDSALEYVNKTYEQNTAILNTVFETVFYSELLNQVESSTEEHKLEKIRFIENHYSNTVKCNEKYNTVIYCPISSLELGDCPNRCIPKSNHIIVVKNIYNAYLPYRHKIDASSDDDEIVYVLNDNRSLVGDDIYNKIVNSCKSFRYDTREILLYQYRDHGILTVESTQQQQLMYDNIRIMETLTATFPQINFKCISCFDTRSVVEFTRPKCS